ncbi:MAG: hypothetical protein LZF86_60002 [Nitrospira sp.]|nr:MAG: hypothetical protein LZF86_60002 [Nitrospira sp.]
MRKSHAVLSVWATIVLWFCAGMLPAHGLEYFDARSNKFNFLGMLSDSIPIEASERVVLEQPYLPAKWVIVVFDKPFDDIHHAVRSVVTSSMGVASEFETRRLKGQLRTPQLNDPKDPIFGDALEDFQAVLPSFHESREYRLLSKPYNILDVATTYSQSEWRLADGQLLFGQPITVLIIGRTDRSREWARSHLGFFWPFKDDAVNHLVTSTEIALVERVSEITNVGCAKYFVPYPGYKVDGMLVLMRAIMAAATSNCSPNEKIGTS